MGWAQARGCAKHRSLTHQRNLSSGPWHHGWETGMLGVRLSRTLQAPQKGLVPGALLRPPCAPLWAIDCLLCALPAGTWDCGWAGSAHGAPCLTPAPCWLWGLEQDWILPRDLLKGPWGGRGWRQQVQGQQLCRGVRAPPAYAGPGDQVSAQPCRQLWGDLPAQAGAPARLHWLGGCTSTSWGLYMYPGACM